MQIESTRFGRIEVDPETIIEFTQPLAGFEGSRRFKLLHEDSAQPIVMWLQSLDEPTLAFEIVDPTTLGFNYELALTDADNALLQSPAAEDVLVMQVLFKANEDGKGAITPNLRAPLVINTKARVGLQKVMESMRPNITLSNLASAV